MEEKLSLEELTALVDKAGSWDSMGSGLRDGYIGSIENVQIWLSRVSLISPPVGDTFNYTLEARYQRQVLGEKTQPHGGSICDLYRKISSMVDGELELKRKELCQQGLQEARKILQG